MTLLMLKLNLLTNLFMQQLTVQNSDQSKAGHGPPFRPLFGNIDYQLKRRAIWPNLEVHVVYALFYILCTNKNGYLEFRKYLSAKDKNVFDPYFIAQYLLAPVNTIVKTWLLPWMMKPWAYLLTENKTKNQHLARQTKAEIFLRYTLLMDLMKIVIKHGRKPNYDFGKDEKLTKIMEGSNGTEGKTTKNNVTCVFNSFLTIWLCTLPEKFKQWYEHHNSKTKKHAPATIIMDLNQAPSFPWYLAARHFTKLALPWKHNYDHLPSSWNLLECFEHYLEQKELRTTQSI